MPTSANAAKKAAPNAYYFLMALLPGMVATLFYSGLKRQDVVITYMDFTPLIKMGVATIAVLVIDMLMLTIKRQPILTALKNPQSLLTGLVLALFLPNHLAWWQITIVMAFAIVVGRYIFDNRLHAVLLGYIFSLGAFTTTMGIALSIKNELYSSYMLTINGAFALGGLLLIYKGLVNWRIPLSLLIIYFGLAVFYKLMHSGIPLSLPLINSALTPTTCLGAFFVAPYVMNDIQNNKHLLLYGIVIGILLFTASLYAHYPDAFPPLLLLVNVITLAIASRTIALQHNHIAILSSNVLLVPIISASMVVVVASSITQAALVGVIVTMIYLATHSIIDVVHRYIPQSAMSSVTIVLTAFFSVYVGLSLRLYFPSFSQSLDDAVPLFALSSLILSFSAIFNGNSAPFTMTNGLKTSGLFFVLVVLMGTINQFTDMNHLVPTGAFLVFAVLALCNHKKLSTINTPSSKPNRRVRATGTIK